MSEYFRKYIKKDHYPLHLQFYILLNSQEIKFKTFFVNCIHEALISRQYKQTQEDDWNIYWCEKQFISETLDKIRLYPDRKINHFRNFYQICRKDLLSKNVKRFKKTLEKEGKLEEASLYNFMPLTYNLPSEYPIFLEEFKRNKEKQKALWIMKPIGRSQGKGIFLFRNISEISEWSEIGNQPEPYIVQRYIHNPLLIGNKKFDLRIYVLVTSHNPLIIYLYRSGFARFTHYRYDANDIGNYASHLTNVAIQKVTQNYDEERGGKYLLDKLRLYMISKFGQQKAEESFFQIQELITKTLVATCKVIVTDKRCFELYGFDIMLDSTLKPWLIQVNGSPSMTANTPIDRNLKLGLLDDTLSIINIEKLLTGEEEQIGGFDIIYNKAKSVKQGSKNFSFLGCLNNRHQQMRKMAKTVALRLADQAKEQKAKQLEQQKNRNKSQAVNGNIKPAFVTGNNNKTVASNNIINRNNQFNNTGSRGTNQSVKLPKVQTPNSNNQIQQITSQLPDISVKRSLEMVNNTTTNIVNRIPTSKDSRRRVV